MHRRHETQFTHGLKQTFVTATARRISIDMSNTGEGRYVHLLIAIDTIESLRHEMHSIAVGKKSASVTPS